METHLMFLLLAAGVSCAPPLELDPVVSATAAPRLENTMTSLSPIELTTSVVTNIETTTQEKLDYTTTESAKLQETTKVSDSLNQKTTVKRTEEIVLSVTTELPTEPMPGTELSTSITSDPNTTKESQPLTELSTTSKMTPTPTPAPIPTHVIRPPYISGKEREALISYLGNVDLNKVDKLILTPRIQQAISQELEHQKLGLTPFTDPTPWQRLTRDQQKKFNRKYLALRQDLQEYSRNKFLSLSEEMQEHAYDAFLTFNIDTLAEIIESEVKRERETAEIQRLAEERERQRLEQEQQQQGQRDVQQQINGFQEQPRSQQGNRLNTFNLKQVEQSQQIITNRLRPDFDPRRTQQRIKQNPFKKRQFKQQPLQQQQASLERLHFQTANEQLKEAVRLQGCLANQSLCRT